MGFAGTGTIWMNGSLVDWADAKVHIASHVIHYGSGVFEGARCYGTPNGAACFRLDAHLKRLFNSAKIYRMDCGIGLDAFRTAVLETVRANKYSACYIRPLIYRGYGAPGVNPFGSPVDSAILCWEWGKYLGADALDQGVDVHVSSWTRSAPNTFPTMAKSVANYASGQLIKMGAVLEGYTEGIALDVYGHVSEGSGENIFLVQDGILFTPPFSSSVLPGITRDSVIRIAHDLGYEVREQVLQREALYLADELFFVGTAAEITPIRSVDKIVVGAGRCGPITKAIQTRFFEIIDGRAPDVHGWLTLVYPGASRADTKTREKVVSE